MLSKLTRILLALVTALVFTGQMEAAAEHCARLAKAAEIKIAAVTHDTAPPCHQTKAAATDSHQAVNHHHKAPVHPDHAKAPPHCECMAALTGWTGAIGATASSHVEAYAWLTPAQATFASAKPDPDLRPPRA